MTDIAGRILEARRAAGLTTTSAFARAVDRKLKAWGYPGISRSAVAQWESGHTSSLKPENLIAVAEVTGHAPKYLATGLKPKRAMEATEHVGVGAMDQPSHYLSEEQMAIARKWSALPDDARELIARFIDSQIR